MVQTRSAVKAVGRVPEANANDDVPQENSSVEVVEGSYAPPSKRKSRRENEVPTNKRRRGKAVELCQLNLDVLFLIARYIGPMDLLNLALTCRSLHELLMDRSSTFVWKSARRQAKELLPCPDDLTELEFMKLLFIDRCHGCGTYLTTILWNVRRRYCSSCKIRRLRTLSSCTEVIRNSRVLPTENVLVNKEFSLRVDKEQAAAFMAEYRQSSNKEQLISDKQKQCLTIRRHAQKCEIWQEQRVLRRKADKKELRRQRRDSIFRRLVELGYSKEINHAGYHTLEYQRECDFRSSKPLTDKGWEKILPAWVEHMNKHRERRLELNVYAPRRHTLGLVYDRYVGRPPSDSLQVELLPHLKDVACFPPFRDIIELPEDSRVNGESFESAFTQLPVLAAKWKDKLDAELTQLVDIPRRLFSASRGTKQSSSADTDKLHLACAVFRIDLYPGAFNYLDVFSVSMTGYYSHFTYDRGDDTGRRGSIMEQFHIQFLREAPFIVHACGLDPRVATVDDMDSRNARLKCLACEERSLIMNWRRAMSHASYHEIFDDTQMPPSKAPRWQLLGDEHILSIQAAEENLGKDSFPSFVRCLLCTPRVGDVLKDLGEVSSHMSKCHDLKIKQAEFQQGVHYAPIGLTHCPRGVVEMTEEAGQVKFTAVDEPCIK